jgi:hypothetical protein
MAKKPRKWMQGVAEHMNKGGLHRALGVPEGKKIPAKKMAKAAHSENPRVRRMVGLAKAFAGAHHHGSHAHHPPSRR